MTCLKQIFRAAIVLACTAAPMGAGEPAAVFRDTVHPVLRNQPSAQLGTLEVRARQAASLEEIVLTLDGTTDLDDVAEIGIVVGKLAGETSPGPTFGKIVQPEARVPIVGNHALSPGSNHFTIFCRLREGARLGSRVRAECVEVKTSAGVCAISHEGNRAAHRIGLALRRAGEEGVHTYRIPALATTTRGTLLCAYDIRRRSSRDLQGDIDVGLSRSTDGGETWEPMRVIMDMGTYGGLPEEQNGVGDPGLVVDPQTNEIFVFALWVHAKPGSHQWQGNGSEPGFEIGKTAQFMLVRSTDDGQTWSAPENITRQVKREEWILFAPSPQQGIGRADGTLVMPVQGRDADDATFATIMTSTDHGRHWAVAPRAYSGGNECQAAELGDGTIMLNIRNDQRKRRAVVTSADGGATWQTHPTHERELIEPTCNGSLYRWTRENGSGDALLLFANPRDEKRRVMHTVQVSFDDGRTWPEAHRLLLDESLGFGYPSLSRIDDDAMGIVYEGSQAHLVFERIERKELTEPPR